MRKLLPILSIIFIVLTFVGAGYVGVVIALFSDE